MITASSLDITLAPREMQPCRSSGKAKQPAQYGQTLCCAATSIGYAETHAYWRLSAQETVAGTEMERETKCGYTDWAK